MKERFIEAARGGRTDRPPVWMMRQAGRYLPEYRELRAEYSFLEAISTPELAAEISLQPWERFQPDGIVMYSDILTVLEPLDFAYHLESGVGPVVENPSSRRPTPTDRAATSARNCGTSATSSSDSRRSWAGGRARFRRWAVYARGLRV